MEIKQETISLYGPQFSHHFATSYIYDVAFQDYLAVTVKTPLTPVLENSSHLTYQQSFVIFYAEGEGAEESYARKVAMDFHQLFVAKVLGAQTAIPPQHLKVVPYRGYSDGIGCDKKQDFMCLIRDQQNIPGCAPIKTAPTTRRSGFAIAIPLVLLAVVVPYTAFVLFRRN